GDGAGAERYPGARGGHRSGVLARRWAAGPRDDADRDGGGEEQDRSGLVELCRVLGSRRSREQQESGAEAEERTALPGREVRVEEPIGGERGDADAARHRSLDDEQRKGAQGDDGSDEAD